MNRRLCLSGRVGAIALGLAISLVGTAPWGHAQVRQDRGEQQAEVETLLKEIVSAAQGGRENLVAWMRANKDRVSGNLLLGLAQQAVQQRDENLLGVTLVLAQEKGDESALAAVCLKAGDFYRQTSNPSRAMELYELVLPVFKTTQNLAGQGDVYVGEGMLYARMGDNTRALAMYEQALSCYQKAQIVGAQGDVYEEEGRVYSKLGDERRALAMYEKALSVYEKVRYPVGQGFVYVAEGDLYFSLGENAKARSMYAKALPIFEKASRPEGQAEVYAGQAGAYAVSGEIERALALYEKALPLFKQAQNLDGQATVYLSEGDLYAGVGQGAKALAMYEGARSLFEKAQNLAGQAGAYAWEGTVYFQMHEPAKALEMFEKALPLAGDFPAVQAMVYQSEGDLFAGTGDYAKALTLYEKALPPLEKVHSPSQGMVYYGAGSVVLRTGNYAKALAMFDKAVEFCRKANVQGMLGYALFGKARTLLASGDADAAAPFFEDAISHLERVRAGTLSLDLKRTLMTSVYEVYEITSAFMAVAQQSEKAFRLAESMKARVFLDSLAEGLVRVDEELAPELREKRDELVGRESALTKQLEAAAGKGDEEKLRALKAEMEGVEDELEKVQMEIRQKNPRYAEVRYPQPITAAELRAKILRPGEVLVEYLLAREAAYAFVVTQDALNAVKLPATPEAISEAVGAYLHWASSGRTRGLKAAAQPPTSSAEQGLRLYEWLVQPLNLPVGATLIVVPDGELAKLPFEALVVSLDPSSQKPVYLLEKRPVKYVQSASVLAILRTEYKQEGTSDAFIGFGDPVYDYQHFRAGEPEAGAADRRGGDFTAELNRDRYDREGGVFDRLQGSGAEVEEIGSLFAVSSRKVNLRLAASEENAKAPDMSGYGYIHFSCHGILGAGFQSLVLSQIPDSKEDGFLTLGEIMACRYRARLVVLSACETGTGAVEKGEGVTGLTRAVMYAGSPATVVSLWSVSDVGTKELMVRFYRKLLQEKVPKDEALRSAKLELLADPKYAAPFFWAPFVMYGE